MWWRVVIWCCGAALVTVLASGPVGAPAAAQVRPGPSLRVAIDDTPVSCFTGFVALADGVDVRQAAADPGVAPGTLVGLRRPIRLQLTKPVDEPAGDVYDWWRQVVETPGTFPRLDIVIGLGSGPRARRWRYVKAWPCEWTIAAGPDGAISETVTFAAAELLIE